MSVNHAGIENEKNEGWNMKISVAAKIINNSGNNLVILSLLVRSAWVVSVGKYEQNRSHI